MDFLDFIGIIYIAFIPLGIIVFLFKKFAKGARLSFHPFLSLARIYLNRRERKKANLFYKLTTTKFLKPNDFIDYGISLHDEKRSDDALNLLKIGQKKYPTHSMLFSTSGHILGELGREQEALEYLDKAISINPDNYYHWYTRALALSDLGNLEEAINDFKESIKRETRNSVQSTWYELGSNYLRAEKYQDAIEAFKEAVKNKDQALSIYYSRLSIAYEADGQINKAIESLEEAVHMHIHVENKIIDGKKQIYRRGRYSVKAYESFLSFAEESYSYIIDLVNLYKNVEQYEKAIEKLTLGIEHYPNSENLYLERAIVYSMIDDDEHAILDYHRSIEINPNFVYGLMERGIFYLKTEKNNEAIADFKKSLSLDSNNPVVYYWLGKAYAIRNEPRKALDYFNELINIEDNDPLNFLERAQTLVDLENYKSAEEDYNTAIEYDDNWDARMKRSYVLYMLGEHEKAMMDIQKAIEMNNELVNDSETYYAMGKVLWGMEKLDQAEEEFTKALNINSKNMTYFEERAYCRYYQDKKEEALLDCNMGLEIDAYNLSLLWLKGLILFQQENYLEALEVGKLYVELNPENPSGYYNIGLIYFILDDNNQALEYMTKSITLDDKQEGAYFQRARIWFNMYEWDKAVDDLYMWTINLRDKTYEEKMEILSNTNGFNEDIISQVKDKMNETHNVSTFLS